MVMEDRRELLIGCGSQRTKIINDGDPTFRNLTTLDINADHKPDVIHDLCDVPLPFAQDTFDEIHAYEVLEHLGSQGDYRLFFRQFEAFWRVLKPGGHLLATCPSRHSVWALGDPSHSRILVKENLVFLSQQAYADQVGKTSMSDFRNIYRADFEPVFVDEGKETFMFVLKAIK